MKKRDLRYVCFRYTLDGREYLDDMGVSMPSEELFRRMSNGAETQTSQVSVEEYIAHFEKMLEDGLDILHVTLSTGLTGTFNAACIARDELKNRYVEERFPKLQGKVEIFPIGTTIGSHTGPGTVALFFWGSPRVD